jgi:hypothetical protein
MTTLDMMVAAEPMEAPALTTVGSTFQCIARCGSPVRVVARGYWSLMNVTPWPMNTPSSMVTPSQMNVCVESSDARR